MDKLPIMSVIRIDMIYSPPGPIVHLAMACSPENMVNETHTHTNTIEVYKKDTTFGDKLRTQY